jgi:hypothetical protein
LPIFDTYGAGKPDASSVSMNRLRPLWITFLIFIHATPKTDKRQVTLYVLGRPDGFPDFMISGTNRFLNTVRSSAPTGCGVKAAAYPSTLSFRSASIATAPRA